MGEEHGRYLYIQTMDRLYSVSLDLYNKLSDSLNVVIKFPEEHYPVGAAINIVNGEFWMIGGEMLRRGLHPPYPPDSSCIDYHDIYGFGGRSKTVYRLFSTRDLNGEHRIVKSLLSCFMQIGKQNPISEVIDDMLYVLPGSSLFYDRWKDVYLKQPIEVYDPVSQLWSRLPSICLGFGQLNHFLLGKKLYIDTGLDKFTVFDTQCKKWFVDEGKLGKSFKMVSRSMPKMDKYLKVDNMHVLFGFCEDLPYAYLVSIVDDVDCDDQVYLRCFQPLEEGFFNDGFLNSKNYIYRGVFVLIGRDKMCCIYSYDNGPGSNPKRHYNDKFVICVIVFSISSAVGKMDPEIAAKIFQSEYIQPCRCTFLDIDIISSKSYTVTEYGVAEIIRGALIYD